PEAHHLRHIKSALDVRHDFFRERGAALEDEVAGGHVRRAADAAPGAAVRRAPELARRVGVEEVRLEHAAIDDEIFARGEAVAVEGARAGAALYQWIVHDRDQRRRDLGAFAAEQVARLAIDGATGDEAEQEPQERAPRLGGEHDGQFAGGDLLGAQLGDGAARGLAADRLGTFQPRAKTIGPAPVAGA